MLTLNEFPQLEEKEFRTPLIVLFIVLNILVLWGISNFYEKTSFGKITTIALDCLTDLNFFKCSSKILFQILKILVLSLKTTFLLACEFIRIFIKVILLRLKFLNMTPFEHSDKKGLSEKETGTQNATSNHLLTFSYFDDNQHFPNSKEELEKVVVLLDTIVLILTAIGLLLTWSIFSSGVDASNQYIFIMLFVSVIITKITANHERIDAKSDLELSIDLNVKEEST